MVEEYCPLLKIGFEDNDFNKPGLYCTANDRGSYCVGFTPIPKEVQIKDQIQPEYRIGRLDAVKIRDCPAHPKNHADGLAQRINAGAGQPLEPQGGD